MSAALVALLVTLGAVTWIYTKLQKYSGNNTKQSATAAGAAGILIFAVLLFVMSKILG